MSGRSILASLREYLSAAAHTGKTTVELGVDLLSDKPSLDYQIIHRKFHCPGIGRTSMISTESPGKTVKCGCFSNKRAAASWDSACTTT